MKPEMTIGSDPEFFVRSGEGGLMPAFTFLPAKHEAKGGPYWDGYQAEFSQPRGYTSQPDHLAEVRDSLMALLTAAREKDKNAQLSCESVVELSPLELEGVEERFVQFGCSPSQNAYGQNLARIEDGRKCQLRFAGGHLHFGGRFSEMEVAGAVRMLDATLGLAMVSMAAGWDDPRRRQYYGLAGEFRLPKHGLEYRTLSNFHVTHPALNHLAAEIGRMACKLGAAGTRREYEGGDLEVVSAINKSDVRAARKILRRNSEFWRVKLAAMFGPKTAKATYAALLEGPAAVGINPQAVERNWASVVGWREAVQRA